MTEYSTWYMLGRWYGLLQWSRRQELDTTETVQLLLAAEVARAVVESIDEATEELTRRVRQDRAGWPEIPPSKKMELSMPTASPARRDTAPWPPFTGVRVELGGDSA